MTYFVFFISATLLIYAVLNILFNRKSSETKTEHNVEEIDMKTGKRNKKNKKFVSSLMTNKIFNGIFGDKIEKAEKNLERANYPLDLNIENLILLYIFIPISISFVVVILLFMKDVMYIKIILFAIVSIIVSSFFINGFIKSAINTRKRKALKELPDFIDLLTINLEAGLGFDLALKRILEKEDGVITQEFKKYLREIEIGNSRKVALENLASRLEIEAINMVTKSIVQAEDLGVSIVKVLRVQSIELRAKRKDGAEEQAMKAPIKILFPLLLFIFPVIFIVLLLPIAIQFIEMK